MTCSEHNFAIFVHHLDASQKAVRLVAHTHFDLPDLAHGHFIHFIHCWIVEEKTDVEVRAIRVHGQEAVVAVEEHCNRILHARLGSHRILRFPLFTTPVF